MRHKSKAVPPYMGEEIEWAILVNDKKREYGLPTSREFTVMINAFRRFLRLPEVAGEDFIEKTSSLSGKEGWSSFLKKLEERQLSVDQGFLPSGFRYYIDGHHLETSSPGCCTLKDLIISSKAAEKIVNFSGKALEKILPKGSEVKVFKDTSNRGGTSFAGHENYLINADTFYKIINRRTNKTMQLASLLAVRSPLCGAGQIFKNRSGDISFGISQRAGFIERVLGIDTTFLRPLINTRDEPHSDFTEQNGIKIPVRRIHIICGEPNMSPASMKMRFGSVMNFLQGMQDDAFDDIQDDIILKNPVRAIKTISSDLRCGETVELADGRKMKFYEILRTINDRMRWYFDEIREPTQEQKEVLDKIDYYCDSFKKGPRYYIKMLSSEIDWINRFGVCNSEFEEGESWSKSANKKWRELYFSDLNYANVDAEDSLYYLRERKYKKYGLIKEEFTKNEVDRRVFCPPEDNREYLRGNILKMFPGLRGDWEMVLLPSRKILWLGDPLKGSREEIGDFSKFSSEDVLIKKLKSFGFKFLEKRRL